ncbi:hypothetical protein, variant 1 [Aphanomyces astaci]|uniref:Uncharacterized protein n=1 Tax=Aphanomyces astaci TaxID=112090 RepID=W4G669_APHAT|nr:hypothetical protein, variant 1 [Aphanomyces astaci]ETV75212.1 hypothetical protein, variant 1 [Aphanomyces astaci]|eukprot:XP_009835259.1 hypothetical protein, variant 1 [Aphanomyces astaci]
MTAYGWLSWAAIILLWTSDVMGWQMDRVTSIQARVQGDKPVWDPTHRVFVSHLGATFEEQYVAMLDTVNLASVEGVLKYVQSEGINQNLLNPASCQRKNNIQYIVFFEVTFVQPSASLAVYQGDPNLVPEYGPFVAMDAGACTSTTADGSVLSDDCVRYFGSTSIPAVGPNVGAGVKSSDPRAPYPNTIWFSYPNSCVMQPWDKKSSSCRKDYPGGLCPFGVAPNGINCSFAYTVLGYLRLDDLVGITNLTSSQTRQLYTSYFEFCQDKNGLYQGVEFKAPDGVFDNKAVTSLPFWSLPFDSQANEKRSQAMVDTYNARSGKTLEGTMRPLPPMASLRNPPCYANAKQCADAPFGCRRDLLAQVCRVCEAQGEGGCVKTPSGFQFPTLIAPTLAPTPMPLAAVAKPKPLTATSSNGTPLSSVALSSGSQPGFEMALRDLMVIAVSSLSMQTLPEEDLLAGAPTPSRDEDSFARNSDAVVDEFPESDLVSRLRLLLLRENESSSPQQQRRDEWQPLVRQLQQCLGQSQHRPPPRPLYAVVSNLDKSTNPIPYTKVSTAAWKSTLQRFESAKVKTQSKLASKRASLEDAETKELSFRPHIDVKSQRMAAHFPSFHERQRNSVAWRDNHVAAEREQRRLNEEAALRPVPDIKTPCLCGHRNVPPSSSSSSPSPRQQHSDACVRFMEICASTNKSFKIQKKTHAMRRSVDDMLAYGDSKYIRQVERSVALQAAEDAEATFSPRINPQSKKIYKAMVQAGRTGKEAKAVPVRPQVESIGRQARKGRWRRRCL